MIDRCGSKKPVDTTSHFPRAWVKVALCAFLLPLCSSLCLVSCGGRKDSGSQEIVIAPTPRLASVDNFRDVAGADESGVYLTSSGQKLRRGMVYRSSALTLSVPDLATLNTLGIMAVYDLRTPGEIAQHPDILPNGAIYLNINIKGVANVPTPILTSAAEAVTAMEDDYRLFVTDSGIRDRFAQEFKELATTSGSQLFHCAGGKDRTGWTTAVLLSLIDVPQSVILQDYMLTNTYSAASIQASYDRMVAAYGKDKADIYFPIFEAKESYLNAALDQVVTSYGSMSGYITNGLGLDAATQAQLRAKLRN